MSGWPTGQTGSFLIGARWWLSHARDRFLAEVLELFAFPSLPRTIAAALRDVESKRPETRRSALVDLARFVDSSERQQVVAVLGRLLQNDPDSEVRGMTAIAIADRAVTDLLPNLLEAVEDPEPRVRQMALLALGEVTPNTDLSAAERIRPLLNSPLPALRYQALVAWSRLVGAEGKAELVVALDDEDAEVRWVAWSLIEDQIDRVTATNTEALRALLLPHANDVSLRIGVVAASVMLRLGDAAQMTRLLERIERPSGVQREDLVAIVQRCGRLKFEPARPWLARIARRGWFEGALGWPAMVALASLGDAAAEAAILQELDAGSARRRGRALEAIRDLRLVSAVGKVKLLAKTASGIDAWLIVEALNALGESGDP